MDAEELLPGKRLMVRRRAYFPLARAHSKALNVFRASPIDWTYLSPATYFVPGNAPTGFV
jgi:putative NADH-flavin reductase